MSDKASQVVTGRIFKEPVSTEKAIRVEIVSNLYVKSDDPKNNTHPLYTTVVLTGGLMKLWASRLSELTKGSRVFVQGDWNFSLFTKKDGTAGFSGSIFPAIFEVTPPRTRSVDTEEAKTPAAAAANKPSSAQEDDLPF